MQVNRVTYPHAMGDVGELGRRIQELAQRALAALPARDPARTAARTAVVRPIDYMRWAEFAAVLAHHQPAEIGGDAGADEAPQGASRRRTIARLSRSAGRGP